MKALREKILAQLQGALLLDIAYIGVVNRLFEGMRQKGGISAAELASDLRLDEAYIRRWCDAAFAFELLDPVDADSFCLSETGKLFLADTAGSMQPFAINAMLAAHMSERAAGLMRTGERPGEKVMAERDTILPWFGPMLEQTFAPMLEKEIIAHVPAYAEVDAKGGLAIDLGCGNGWYLRGLARRLPHVRGIGLDGFEENIQQAQGRAGAQGLSDRLEFIVGDINKFSVVEQADLIAMNRALHHVWHEKEHVFRFFSEHLKPDGVTIIWEPNWPQDRAVLRQVDKRGMAFQNLSEHVQGNHFLRPDEIAEQFRAVGMDTEVFLFANDREAVIVGRKG